MRMLMWAFSSEYVCVYFTYIYPGVETNGYSSGTHSAGKDEVAHVSFLI